MKNGIPWTLTARRICSLTSLALKFNNKIPIKNFMESPVSEKKEEKVEKTEEVLYCEPIVPPSDPIPRAVRPLYRTLPPTIRHDIIEHMKEIMGLPQASGLIVYQFALKYLTPQEFDDKIQVATSFVGLHDPIAPRPRDRRKKMRFWLTSEGKGETRGGCILRSTAQKEEFEVKVLGILRELQTRSFPQLRAKILPIVKESIDKWISPPGAVPFTDDMCSKRWWFSILNHFPSLKAKWTSIKFPRNRKN